MSGYELVDFLCQLFFVLKFIFYDLILLIQDDQTIVAGKKSITSTHTCILALVKQNVFTLFYLQSSAKLSPFSPLIFNPIIGFSLIKL